MKTIDDLLEAVKWIPAVKIEKSIEIKPIKRVPKGFKEDWLRELAESARAPREPYTMYFSHESKKAFDKALEELVKSEINENNR
jgi:hypothetical protein